MPSQPYLLLQTVHLQPATEWVYRGEGMVFVLAQSGSGQLMSPAGQRPFVPGDALVLSGATTGRLVAAADSRLVFGCFSLAVEHLSPLFDGWEIAVLPAVVEGFKTAKYYAAAESTARETHRLVSHLPERVGLEYRSQLLRAAAVVLAVEFKEIRQRHNHAVPIEERMVQVFEKLSNAEILNSSAAELATRFGCTRRHLDRLFLQHFGISASALRTEMRLIKAMALLRNPEAKVINVANECGFNHLGLFNVRFKKRFGVSPGQWRERASQSPMTPPQGGGHPGSCRLRSIGLCPDAVSSPVVTPPAPAGGKLSVSAK